MYAETICGLEDKDQLAMFWAVTNYSLNGEEPKFTGVKKSVWLGLKTRIDRDLARYRNGCKGKEYGKLGGAPKGNTNARKSQPKVEKPAPNNKLLEGCDKESDYYRFQIWVKKNCPFVYGNLKMLSEGEFLKLKEKYTTPEIISTLQQIENRKDLRKRYTNLYRTLLNWLKNEYTAR